MAVFAACMVLLSCLVVSSVTTPMRAPNCRKCLTEQECYSFPSPNGVCEFGPYMDQCGFANCHKGPGERCSSTKRCATGLECLCGRCTGCLDNNIEKPCYSRNSVCPDAAYVYF